MADTWGNSDDSGGGLDRSNYETDNTDYSNDPDYGSYGPRGPITNSGQQSGYTPGGGNGPFGGRDPASTGAGGGGSYGPRGPITSSNQQSGYTPPAAPPMGVGGQGGGPVPTQAVNTPAAPPQGIYGGGNLVPTINIPQSPAPFFSNITGSMTLTPGTVGMPSILLSSTGSANLPAPAGPTQSETPYQAVPPVNTPQYNFMPGGGVPMFQREESPYKMDNLSPTSPQQDFLRSQAIQNTEAANRQAGLQRALRSTVDSYLGKTAGVESGFGTNIANPASTATGIFQFTNGTWMSTFQKTFPDLFNQMQGNTPQGKAAILSMKTGDPAFQTEMARSLTMDNAAVLSKNQLPVTEGNLYMSHFLGSTGAVNVLTADDNAPVSTVVSPDAITANPFLRDMSVGQLKSWANGKMSSVDTQTARDYIASITGGEGAASPYTGRTLTYDSMPKGPVVAGEAADAINEAAVRAAQQTPGQAATSSPDTFGAWLDRTFGTSDQVKNLEQQGRTVLFPDSQPTDEEGNPISVKEWYRQDMENQLGRPVSIDEVQSRIVGSGSNQRVDYYTKGLGQALGEAFTAPFSAVGNLFSSSEQSNVPPPNVPAAQAASANPNTFGSWLDSLFNPADRIKTMESQGQTSIFAGTPDTWSQDQIEALTDPETGELMSPKQWYANQFANGDINAVKTRINAEGKVDYYVKGLDDVIGEVITGPFRAIGNMFGGSTAAPQTSGIRSLGNENGGNNPNNLRPPADIPDEQPPEEPDYTTGIDMNRRVYSGNPLVAYNYDLVRRGLIT